jgi:hypothetical protein
MRDLVARGAQGIVLGCTEISLLVSTENMPGAFLCDTTALHVDRAVRISLGLHPLITDPVWASTPSSQIQFRGWEDSAGGR